MTAIVVEAKIPSTEQEVSVEYDFGDTVEEAIQIFGADVVFSNFKSACTVTLQGFMRGQMKVDKEGNAKSDEEIAAAVAGWTPGQRASRSKSKGEKLKELLAGMDESQIAELLAEATAAE